MAASDLFCAAAVGEAGEVEDNRNAEQKTAHRMNPVLLDRACGMSELLQDKSNRKAGAADGSHAPGLGIELPILMENTHEQASFRWVAGRSISEAVPEHHGDLDGRHGADDGKQIPADEVLEDESIFEDAHRDEASYDAGQAGGAEAMIEEALIDKRAKDGGSAEDGMVHCLFSN
jgi:hypothetical protein